MLCILIGITTTANNENDVDVIGNDDEGAEQEEGNPLRRRDDDEDEEDGVAVVALLEAARERVLEKVKFVRIRRPNATAEDDDGGGGGSDGTDTVSSSGGGGSASAATTTRRIPIRWRRSEYAVVDDPDVVDDHPDVGDVDKQEGKERTTAKRKALLLSAVVVLDEDDDNNDSFFAEHEGPLALAAEAEEALNGNKGDNKGGRCFRRFGCEVWATSPAPLPLLLSSRRRNTGVDDYDSIDEFENGGGDDNRRSQRQRRRRKMASAMRKRGLVVQDRLLRKEKDVSELRRIVDAAIAGIELALQRNRPHVNVGEDVFCFREIASRSRRRIDLRLTSPEAEEFVETRILQRRRSSDGNNNTTTTTKDDSDDTIVDNGVCEFLNDVLCGDDGDKHDDGFDYDISVVYSKPGADAQGWHSDGRHLSLQRYCSSSDDDNNNGDPRYYCQGDDDDDDDKEDGEASTAMPPLSKPYAVCMFLPLIRLDDEVGYTQFWPGSHRSGELLGFGKVAELCQATWNGICPNLGDAVWYDYRLLHRGMPNRSEDTLRPVLQIVFKKKWYVERANYGEESVYV